MQHGRDWTGEDVSGWFAAEKLDGVRAYWDGDTLWSRSGRAIPVPAVLRRQLPLCHLDGEIWAGRAARGPALCAARGNWLPGVRFMIFDCPTTDGLWPERLAYARNNLRPGDHAAVMEFSTVSDLPALDYLVSSVLAGGGEGLMLRHPAARHYHHGRIRSLLKLKRRPLPWWRRLAA